MNDVINKAISCPGPVRGSHVAVPVLKNTSKREATSQPRTVLFAHERRRPNDAPFASLPRVWFPALVTIVFALGVPFFVYLATTGHNAGYGLILTWLLAASCAFFCILYFLSTLESVGLSYRPSVIIHLKASPAIEVSRVYPARGFSSIFRPVVRRGGSARGIGVHRALLHEALYDDDVDRALGIDSGSRTFDHGHTQEELDELLHEELAEEVASSIAGPVLWKWGYALIAWCDGGSDAARAANESTPLPIVLSLATSAADIEAVAREFDRVAWQDSSGNVSIPPALLASSSLDCAASSESVLAIVPAS